ncbi:hypothetical protein [Catellatospora coxensis]|uniref:Uncharacterized protein n=1 Tax=Catellatospora coxensis TaxID=310354 RepID=A0A8J3L338_9ACTN|nr:hypothetical protein [Catellatospora coxensis]GIG06820.1 hypothetical protein Cco03nite_35200 [Catellatospora coxensis]
MGAWIKDHLSLVIAIAVGVTVLTKIWSVAHGNEYTMAALFTSQGGLNVTIAALVAGLPSLGYLPMVLTYPALIAAAWAGHSLRGPVIAAVIASILAFATIPTGYLLIYLVVAVASIGSSFLIVWIRRRLLAKGRDPGELPFVLREPKSAHNTPLAVGLAVFGLLGWLWVATRDTPWIPVERITQSTSGPVVGYILDEDGAWFTVMLEDDRRVVNIPSAQVSQRQPCSRGDERTPLVMLVWPEPAAYPDC